MGVRDPLHYFLLWNHFKFLSMAKTWIFQPPTMEIWLNFFIFKVRHDIHFNLTILSDVQYYCYQWLPFVFIWLVFLVVTIITYVFDRAAASLKQDSLNPVVAVFKMANTNVCCDFSSFLYICFCQVVQIFFTCQQEGTAHTLPQQQRKPFWRHFHISLKKNFAKALGLPMPFIPY